MAAITKPTVGGLDELEGQGVDAGVGASLPLALALTMLSGVATGVGGLLVVGMQSGFSARTLGWSQGLSAGFMISVTLLEILPEALTSISLTECVTWCCVGAAMIFLLKELVPEPDLSALAGGGGPLLGGVGAGGGNGSKPVYGGGGESIPHINKVLWSGLLTAASLALHNFPEGIAVSVASTQGLKFSLPLTIAVALHNIPEGCSVALPIYYGTRSKRKAVLMSLLSGMAEPLGVLFVFAVGAGSLTQRTVACLLAVVGGIMIGLSIFELLPQARELTSTAGALKAASLGFVAMAVIMAGVHSLDLE